MSLVDIKDLIEGLNKGQKTYFNRLNESKIYNEEILTLSQQEEDEVEDLDILVSNLSDEDLGDLNDMLSSKRKLSSRPC